MLENFRDATPAEFAAFFELGQFILGDMEAVAKQFLKQGHDGENIANLAFDFSTSGLGRRESFQTALIEAGIPRLPSRNESVWLAVRYYLLRIEREPLKARDIFQNVIDLEGVFGDVELFQYTGRKFVGQPWGVENLIGLFYSPDDMQFDFRKENLKYDSWLEKVKRTLNEKIVQESIVVRHKFYSKDAELPIALKNVRELI